LGKDLNYVIDTLSPEEKQQVEEMIKKENDK